ncbi:MAG: LytR/AlgR family response regulator transcription factor [Lachnospirales bacterium]
MINIGIVDDNKIFVNLISEKIEKYFKENDLECSIYTYWDPKEFLNDFQKNENKFNYIFLDYDMPEINGLELGRNLRLLDKDFKLIYITSLDEKVYQCLKNNVYRFIRKSKLQEELQDCLDSINDLETLVTKATFYTTINPITVPFNVITYIETTNKKFYLHTLDFEFTLRKTTLKDIYDILPKEDFVYISKGIILNLNNVKDIQKLDVTLKNDEVIYISRRKQKEVTFAYLAKKATIL